MSDATQDGKHYAYPLVTWGSTILGAVVALIISFMLNLLGGALGIVAATVGQMQGAAAEAGIAGIVWVAVSNLFALGFGAWVAGRSTANPDHHGGTLQGIAVWAVTSFAVLFLAGSALSSLGGAALKTADIAASASGASAQPATRDRIGAQAQSALQNGQDAMQQNPAAVQDAVTRTAKTTAEIAFGAFMAMVLGLVAAIFGARAGARHPNWADRPRFTLVERTHPRV